MAVGELQANSAPVRRIYPEILTGNGEVMTRLRQITAALASLLVLSCGGDGGGGGGTPTEPDNTVANVTVNGASTIAPGGQSQMTAVAVNASGYPVSGLTATWSSSATSVATVSNSGLVSAVATGTATITATIGGKPGTRQVTVQTVNVSPTATVTVSGSAFSPPQVDIAAGGTVTWNFDDYVEHTVTFSGTGTPENIPASMSTAVERTFPVAGTYPYSCSIHYGMSGTVVVH
jgi:plastocyanin